MASVEDLIATMNGGVHVGREGYDLQALQVSNPRIFGRLDPPPASADRVFPSLVSFPGPPRQITRSKSFHGLSRSTSLSTCREQREQQRDECSSSASTSLIAQLHGVVYFPARWRVWIIFSGRSGSASRSIPDATIDHTRHEFSWMAGIVNGCQQQQHERRR